MASSRTYAAGSVGRRGYEPQPQRIGGAWLEASYIRSLAMLLGVVAILVILGGTVMADVTGDTLPGLMTLGAVILLLRLFLRFQDVPREDQEWIRSLCLVALLLRAIVATVLYTGPWDYYAFGEDQTGYDYLPQVMAKYWEGEAFRPQFLSEPSVAGRIGYYNLVTAQYYVFGAYFLVPRIFNALAGGLIVFYAYRLSRTVFGIYEGRLAAVAAAFFPSLILWSALNMRDIWLALSVIVIVYQAMCLRNRFTMGALVTLLAHFVWIQYTRSYLVLVMGAACCCILLLARGQRFIRDLTVGVVFVGIVATLNLGFGMGQEGIEWLDLERIAQQRERMSDVLVGKSGYLGDVDFSNPVGVGAFLPIGLAYFLFSPFPWQMIGIRRLVTLPEMLIWYWSFPFLVIAARRALRERAGDRVALLIPVLVLSIAYAIGSANMGLAYRYRAQIVALYLAFATAGYVQRRAPTLAGVRSTPGEIPPPRG